MMIVPCYRCKWIFPFDACSAFLFLPSKSRYTGDIPDAWEYIYIYIFVCVCVWCIAAFITAENFCSFRSYRVAYDDTTSRPLSIANFIRIRVCPFRIYVAYKLHQRPVPVLSCFVCPGRLMMKKLMNK